MKKDKLLSIAIPTYNRERELKECLESILEQIDGFEEVVEIVISDNASTDNTRHVVDKICSINKKINVVYRFNKKNEGMDANFLNCIILANGKYIHMLSDDDILLPGALQYILEIIAEEEPDYIHLNSAGMEEYRIRRKEYINGISSRFSEKNIIRYYNKNEFLSYIGIYVTFLSSIVYKSELVKNIPNKEKFIGTFFLQSHLALLTIAQGEKMIFAGRCCVLARTGNSGGYNLFDVWIKNYKALLCRTAIDSGFSRKVCIEIFKKSCKKEIRGFILAFRINNTGFDLNNRGNVVLYTWMYPSLWKYLYPVTFLPINLVGICKK